MIGSVVEHNTIDFQFYLSFRIQALHKRQNKSRTIRTYELIVIEIGLSSNVLGALASDKIHGENKAISGGILLQVNILIELEEIILYGLNVGGDGFTIVLDHHFALKFDLHPDSDDVDGVQVKLFVTVHFLMIYKIY